MYRFPLSLLLAFALTTLGCHRAHKEPEEVPKYLVTNPLRKDTELTREYVAQIRAKQHIELRALEKGYLQGTFVDEGKQVAKGTRLFQIMPMMYQAELQKAAAEAEVAQVEYNNTKLLADKNVVSSSELALSKAKLNKAAAQVSFATTQKSLTELRAPFDGIVGRFQARMGSLLDEGDLLTTLSDNSTVWVYFNVSEAEYLDYKSTPHAADAPVKLVMANGEPFDQPGKVETIEADFNNENGNLAFRATFANPNGLLRHGETGKIQVAQALKNALLVPQKATFDVLDKKFVYVVDENNVVHSRPITVRAELPQLFAIATGLTENDKVLVEGLRKVHDGVTIEPDYKPSTDVLAHLEVRAE